MIAPKNIGAIAMTLLFFFTKSMAAFDNYNKTEYNCIAENFNWSDSESLVLRILSRGVPVLDDLSFDFGNNDDPETIYNKILQLEPMFEIDENKVKAYFQQGGPLHTVFLPGSDGGTTSVYTDFLLREDVTYSVGMELGLTSSSPFMNYILKDAFERFHDLGRFETEEKCRTDKICKEMLNFVEKNDLERGIVIVPRDKPVFFRNPVVGTIPGAVNFSQPFLSALDDLPLEFELEPYMKLVQRFGFGFVSLITIGYADTILGHHGNTKLYRRYGKKISYQGPACADPVPSQLHIGFGVPGLLLDGDRLQKYDNIDEEILGMMTSLTLAPTSAPTLAPTLAPSPPTTLSPTTSPTSNAAASDFTTILLSSMLLLLLIAEF